MKHPFFTILTIVALYVPVLVHGEDYVPLVGIPGVDPTADFSGYINSLYALSISIAALLAVIKIVIAGVKWMMTDIVTSKGDAKKDIQGALVGLLIVLAAVLILTVINPDLVNVNLTLTEPGAVGFASTTATAATLDATKIKSFGIPGTTATISYMDSTDATQQSLFSKSCNPTVSGFTDPQVRKFTVGGKVRCATYKPTEVASLWPGTKEICNSAGNNTGVYKADPVITTTGFCVYSAAGGSIGGTAPGGGGTPTPGGGSYSLAVTKGAIGSGTIVSNPAGINCGPSCAVWNVNGIVPGIASFPAGTQVTITVTPSAGFKFSGWGAACSIAGFTGTTCDSQPSFGSCTINLDESKCISVYFAPL